MNEDDRIMKIAIKPEEKQVIRKHWNCAAVFTDAWNRDKKESEVSEAELLLGELSAVTFLIGCYTVRSARRVYRVYEPGYRPKLETPAEPAEIALIKKDMAYLHAGPDVSVTTGIGVPSWQDKFRITHEISAKHNDNPNEVFTYVCRAAGSTNYRWCEKVDSICTAKDSDLIPEEYASLFVCNTYVGDLFSADT